MRRERMLAQRPTESMLPGAGWAMERVGEEWRAARWLRGHVQIIDVTRRANGWRLVATTHGGPLGITIDALLAIFLVAGTAGALPNRSFGWLDYPLVIGLVGGGIALYVGLRRVHAFRFRRIDGELADAIAKL